MRGDWERAVRGLAKRQWGVFAVRQVTELGMPKSTRARWAERGRLEELLPGVYRVGGVPLAWAQRVMAAWLWAGPKACVSHGTAGRLWGLEGLPEWMDEKVELSISGGGHPRRKGIALHRTRSAPPMVWQAHRFPLTSLSRTVIDLAATLREDRLEVALDSACRKRPGLVAWIWRDLEALGTHPRRGSRVLKALLEARGGNITGSVLEVQVLRALRKARVPRPVTQHVHRDAAGTRIGCVDFAWPERRVVLEVDGWRYHGGRREFDRDVARRNALVASGQQVITVTSESLRDGVWLGQLRLALGMPR